MEENLTSNITFYFMLNFLSFYLTYYSYEKHFYYNKDFISDLIAIFLIKKRCLKIEKMFNLKVNFFKLWKHIVYA